MLRRELVPARLNRICHRWRGLLEPALVPCRIHPSLANRPLLVEPAAGLEQPGLVVEQGLAGQPQELEVLALVAAELPEQSLQTKQLPFAPFQAVQSPMQPNFRI